ncbi:MAG: phosphoenolpyruvate synthase [Clostridiales bacterium]|nr:phosphoenolpyruvate synthase [Clostridiales bacterium]
MVAFEKISSGIPSLDTLLDYIRIGDNVVFQVSSLQDYSVFVDEFVRQAKRDERRLIYMRFAQHPPLVSAEDAVTYTLNPDEGFEPFTTQVHNIVTDEGLGAFYVFDCLSELQGAWAADLMMGNFFRVICPHLFKMDTVAFFPLMRSDHAFDTLARIRETTQLFLDVYSAGELLYIHPIKVWNRYSPTMFMPHASNRRALQFSALTDAVDASHFYSVVPVPGSGQDLDSWARYFQDYAAGPPDGACDRRTCRMMLTTDSKIAALLDAALDREDYLDVKARMIGTGRIGGKACGMLLARKILARELPALARRTEPHDSFFIGDHVFYTFLVYNGLWDLRVAQKSGEGYYALAGKLAGGIMNGGFPDTVRAMFRRTLEYFGQSPIIVRSSSLLEDGFGNAFAGKYESVFCVNQGDPQQRLAAFESAVKTVYASTMNRSALEYRARRGLQEKDEQMSILVQRVSGSVVGRYFYPSAAGVGYSYDPYNWNRSIDPGRGLLRMVCGLGTRAVDRTGQDYPRLIHIGKPAQSTLVTADEKVRFSQHYADVLDLTANRTSSIPIGTLVGAAPAWYGSYVAEYDRTYYATCRGFTENPDFLADMENILAVLQREYGCPVDIEYTANLSPSGEYVICILQCRPLVTLGYQAAATDMPSPDGADLLFEAHNTSMGISLTRKIDTVVLVSSEGYNRLPYRNKSEIVGIVSKINHANRAEGKAVMLICPGRIGTASPELGVPLRFSDISCFSMIVEYDDAKLGFLPELSFGSHLFQDLVESRIYYSALFSSGSNRSVFRPELLEEFRLAEPENRPERLGGIVAVYDVSRAGLTLYHDMVKGHSICMFHR